MKKILLALVLLMLVFFSSPIYGAVVVTPSDTSEWDLNITTSDLQLSGELKASYDSAPTGTEFYLELEIDDTGPWDLHVQNVTTALPASMNLKVQRINDFSGLEDGYSSSVTVPVATTGYFFRYTGSSWSATDKIRVKVILDGVTLAAPGDTTYSRTLRFTIQ